jgi:hypothetical protein
MRDGSCTNLPLAEQLLGNGSGSTTKPKKTEDELRSRTSDFSVNNLHRAATMKQVRNKRGWPSKFTKGCTRRILSAISTGVNLVPAGIVRNARLGSEE